MESKDYKHILKILFRSTLKLNIIETASVNADQIEWRIWTDAQSRVNRQIEKQLTLQSLIQAYSNQQKMKKLSIREQD